jgi:hypothetical protein
MISLIAGQTYQESHKNDAPNPKRKRKKFREALNDQDCGEGAQKRRETEGTEGKGDSGEDSGTFSSAAVKTSYFKRTSEKQSAKKRRKSAASKKALHDALDVDDPEKFSQTIFADDGEDVGDEDSDSGKTKKVNRKSSAAKHVPTHAEEQPQEPSSDEEEGKAFPRLSCLHMYTRMCMCVSVRVCVGIYHQSGPLA